MEIPPPELATIDLPTCPPASERALVRVCDSFDLAGTRCPTIHIPPLRYHTSRPTGREEGLVVEATGMDSIVSSGLSSHCFVDAGFGIMGLGFG